MVDDTNHFVASCLYYASASVGVHVARPLGHVAHADELNRFFHFYYLHMVQSFKGIQSSLVVLHEKNQFLPYFDAS